MAYEFRLYQDRLAAKCTAKRQLVHPVTALYVVAGSLRLTGGVLGANSAWHPAAQWTPGAGSLPTIVLRWELVAAGSPDNALSGEGVESRLMLASAMLLDPAQKYLLRCDRVDFPPGGVALTHTHAGAGTRCVLFGGIRIRCLGEEHAYGPLEPWFEAGADSVFASASASEATAFARVMILPRELLGKSSIRYVNAEDLDKPKNQSYQVFLDQPVELPPS
ncbi:MAG: hypothetical protein Q8K18_03855 [Burkholderiales bacterium]|nr:hypothetical protein [Burkholderiales bacterium]